MQVILYVFTFTDNIVHFKGLKKGHTVVTKATQNQYNFYTRLVETCFKSSTWGAYNRTNMLAARQPEKDLPR